MCLTVVETALLFFAVLCIRLIASVVRCAFVTLLRCQDLMYYTVTPWKTDISKSLNT